MAGANYLKSLIEDDNFPTPTHLVSSDLRRSVESAQLLGHQLGISKMSIEPGLRAFGGAANETSAVYRQRSEAALKAILGSPGLPLLVGHRSFQSFLAKKYFGAGAVDDDPGWVEALTSEGGLLGIAADPDTLVPLFKVVWSAWPISSVWATGA
jgi:broad specificity phosphatase PhoE